ncbi:MAG: 4Fe-4S dicluster domain-containing protein [Planctomycetota bacterium]|jgi:MauM/NapG family ferredoxin protein
MSDNKPDDISKRTAMRDAAGGAFELATRYMPAARVVKNFDPKLFKDLYEAADAGGLPKDFTDVHGRRFFRPPGAIPEDEFLKACSTCGKCVEVCPENCIKPSDGSIDIAKNTPMLMPNHSPCTLCGDCMEICPTGALVMTNVGDIRIGIAVIEPETCIGHMGEECRECLEFCPLEPEAISLDGTKPKVDSRICTGCGLCVEGCPTKPQSIIVLPRPKRT